MAGGRWLGGVGVVVLAAALGGCSASPSATLASFSRPGPDAVGVTTLDLGADGSLGERLATVYYPAERSRLAGHPLFSYQLSAPLPAAVDAIVPPRYNATVTTDARVGAPGAPHGPFPVVLFSHGFGASRLYYSHLLTGIASWGFVVVSADYLERGLLSQATHSTLPDSAALDLRVMFRSLAATEHAATLRSSPLYHLTDDSEIAAVGHSAGGQTAFDALDDPRVKTAVGWAPVGPADGYARKPVTVIGEQQDIALTPATLDREFHRFPGSTSYLQISGEGHNTYTDICTSIRAGGGGLVGFAISLHLVSQELAKLAVNGCTAANLPPQRFWPVVQSATVAALRSGLGLGPAPAPPPSRAFPGFTLTYHHHG
ncbi:MAG TPA: dienelactone hydrolase family protein [Acidimicrobiales bacterium]|nr:dienelactone hydrolase family protein [Acidimicrobiales bacterium]